MDERAHPVHRQRARRRRRQGRRAAAVLRRRHLRHRRRAGPRPAHPRRGPAALATAPPTSSRSTTRTPTASRPGTCPQAALGRGDRRRQRRPGRRPDARPHRRRAAVHRHPGARARGAGRTRPSPTCTCSPGAARPRPSSPRWSCASWTTRRTCRSSSRPRAWSSTTSRRRRCPGSKSLRMVVDVLTDWAMRDPEPGPHRRIHIHFLENPVEMLGDGRRGRAGCAPSGRNSPATAPSAAPASSPTGTCRRSTAPSATARRRSRTCRSTPRRLVLPNDGGRVLDLDGEPLPGLYATGWVKRGPVGLIGHTKSDAAETVAHLLADAPDFAAGAAPRRRPRSTPCWPARACRSPTSPAGTGSTRTSCASGAPHGRDRVKRALPHRHDPRSPPAPDRAATDRRARTTAWTRRRPRVRAATVGAGRARGGTGYPREGSNRRRRGQRSRQWCTRSRASSPASKDAPVELTTVLVPDPGPGEALVARAGLRGVPHRPALQAGRHRRRLPVPARPRGRRRRRGGRRKA